MNGMATKRTFDDPLEPLIYWDTSFVIAAFVPPEAWHAECNAFRVRLDTEGTVSVVSEFVYDETAFIRLRDLLTPEAFARGISWQALRRADPTAQQGVMSHVEFLRRELERQTIDLPLTAAVRVRAFQLMNDFNLLPTDAYHIAAAFETGVTAFASLDADFLNVDGIIVYTCLP